MNNQQQTRGNEPSKFKPFFNADGSLVLDWVGEEAKKLAEKVCYAKDHGLKATGLRNFYNEFLRIKSLPAGHEEEKIVLIKLLVAKVQYKKISNNAPAIFADFITQLVKEIGNSVERFEKACLIMEALVGYNPRYK